MKLPREHSVWETWLMLSCTAGLGSATYAVLRELDPTRDRPGFWSRLLAFGLAVVSIAAAVMIGAG